MLKTRAACVSPDMRAVRSQVQRGRMHARQSLFSLLYQPASITLNGYRVAGLYLLTSLMRTYRNL